MSSRGARRGRRHEKTPRNPLDVFLEQARRMCAVLETLRPAISRRMWRKRDAN